MAAALRREAIITVIAHITRITAVRPTGTCRVAAVRGLVVAAVSLIPGDVRKLLRRN